MTLDIYPFIVQKNEKPYLFKFDENASHKGIKISARSEDVIEFEPVIFEFENLDNSKKALIYINFGFEDGLSYQDELKFKNAIISLEDINKKILTPYKDKIDGVIFYEGTCFFEKNSKFSQEDIGELVSENLISNFSESFVQQIAAMNLLASMVHRLAAFIPDDMPVFCKFMDSEKLSLIDRAIYFSKERFEHVFAAISNPSYQYTTLDLTEGHSMLGSFGKTEKQNELIDFAVLLPSDDYLSKIDYQNLNETLQVYVKQAVSFRVIPEKIFNECWNELSKVAFIEGSLSPMTERMVKGFIASGGEVITL